jgi:peptidoglycan/xylan/chitin deacetylase (PgdA/CDA1 family)
LNSLSRRRLIQAGIAVTGAALIAGDSADRAQPPVSAALAPPGLAPGSPSPSAAPSLSPSPSPMEPLARPVFTLSDYRKIVPGPAFPDNAVALTIDDGPHPAWTPQVLRLLERYNVPALFCLIGNQVLGHENVARSIVEAGHQVANHTWSHPAAIAGLPADRVQQEIDRAQEKIHDTTGHTPSIFRSPGGAVSPTVFAAAAKARMIPMNWSDDPRDWTRPGVQAITNRLLAARPGQILLCHDGGGDRSQTCTALRTVLPALQARGLQFVALAG